MKIEMNPKYNVYRKAAGSDTGAAPLGHETAAAAKRDVISITHGSTSTDKAMIGMKAGVHSYLAAPADSERLSTLRDQVRSGSYRIDTDDLVQSILKG